MSTRLVVFLTAALAGLSAQAQTCNSNIPEATPASQFVIDAQKGIVLDKATGLMWKRCAEGRSGADCSSGSVATYNWGQALVQAANSAYAGYSDWRLPNLKELASLVEERCYGPAINLTVFPGTASDGYWAASPYANVPVYAWNVAFDGGYSGYDYRYYGLAVRLVRSGQ
jgi:hypothetical protein